MNILELTSEKELISSRLEKMIFGTVDIREKENKKYIYVQTTIDGIKRNKYVGEYSNELYNLILENNQVAKQLKKRIKEINKELDSINYETHDLSEKINLNISLARRNMADSIYKQAMLEGVATTYSDTETIINGGKVNNMTVSDIGKVVNLKRAWEFILSNGVISYPTNYVVLCEINQIIEDGFSLFAGRLRSVPVSIGGSNYIPPLPIENIIKKELQNILNSDLSIIDKTIELLLFISKKQLFLDGNKRTAVIFANHFLISNAGGIIVIPVEKIDKYKKLLIEYYESKNNDIKDFLKNECIIRL